MGIYTEKRQGMIDLEQNSLQSQEDDLYSEDGMQLLLENEEISNDEEAFMQGYLRGLPDDYRDVEDLWLDEEEEW